MAWAYLLELRRSAFRFLFPIQALVSFYLAVTASFPHVAEWSDLEQALQGAAIFWAPFLAALGAWSGLRSSRRKLRDQERLSIRAGWVVRLPQYVAVLTWVIGAHLAVFLALYIRGSVIGLYGSPESSSLLRTALIEILAVTVGFVIAELLHSWLSVVIAAGVLVGLVSLQYIPQIPIFITAANPLHVFTPVALGVPNAQFFAGQCLLTLGLCGVLWGIGTLTNRGGASVSTAAFALLGIGLTVLGGGLVVGTGENDMRLPPDSAQKWITIPLPESGAQLRVVALYAPVRGELANEWDRIAVLLSGSTLKFTTLSQDTNPVYTHAPGKFFRLDLNPDASDIAAQSVESGFNDLTSCTFDGRVGKGDWSIAGNIVFTTWLAGQKEFPSHIQAGDPSLGAALQRMRAKDTLSSQKWIAGHTHDIQTCSWNQSDFR